MTRLGSNGMLAAVLAAALTFPWVASAQMKAAGKPQLLDPEVAASLVERAARIGEIQVVAEYVFDPSKPEGEQAPP